MIDSKILPNLWSFIYIYRAWHYSIVLYCDKSLPQQTQFQFSFSAYKHPQIVPSYWLPCIPKLQHILLFRASLTNLSIDFCTLFKHLKLQGALIFVSLWFTLYTSLFNHVGWDMNEQWISLTVMIENGNWWLIQS